MRTKPFILTPLAVSLFSVKLGIALDICCGALGVGVVLAQTEPLTPPEIQSTPLPSPAPPPLLPAQEETIRQLIETEIDQGREIGDRIDDEVNDAFGLTMGLLNLLITLMIAVPVGTGFVLWWLRQSVIDRLVRDIRQQFQLEAEQLVKQQLEQEVAAKFRQQMDAFEQELQQLRAGFTERLHSLYQDAEGDKAKIVQELEILIASVDPDAILPAAIEQRLHELTQQLDLLKTSNAQLSAQDYLKEGDALYLGRQHQEAITAYRAALDLNPDAVDAWVGLAKSLRRTGNCAEAVAANEEVIRRQPHHGGGWFGKGYALADMQQYEAALEPLDKATQLDPNRGIFWQQKGYVLAKLGQYSEALECLDQAVRLKPQSGQPYYSKAYYHAVQHQPELAVEYLKEAIRYRPDFYERVKTDPDFDDIRQTSAFQHLLKTYPLQGANVGS